MKIVTFTDLHIHLNNVQESNDIVDQIITICKDQKIDVIICKGDVFESRKAQPLQSLKTFENILKKINSNSLILYCIPGNHDKVDYKSFDSYLDQFQHWPAFELIKGPYTINNKTYTLNFLPFFEDEVYCEQIKKLELIEDIPNYLFTHIGVDGASNNEGVHIRSSVKKSLFNDFKEVFTGHYHNRSNLGHIHYIGSPRPTNFGENNDKGCVILNIDDKTGVVTWEYVKLKFKEYNVIELDIDNQIDIKKAKLEYQGSTSNTRFVFKGDKEKLKTLDKREFESLGIDVKVERKEDQVQNSETELVEFNKESIENEFDIFCKENNIVDLDKEIGLEYLKQKLYGSSKA